MTEYEIAVHCGRCGRDMIVGFDDLRDKRTIECADCERRIERLVLAAAQPAEAGRER